MASNHLLLLTLGGALLVTTWLAWSGRWRSWATNTLNPMPITIVPTQAGWMLAAGASPVLPRPLEVLFIVTAVLGALGGIVLAAWQPRWLGPRWYRWRREAEARLPARAKAARMSEGGPSAGNDSELTARRSHDGQRLLARRWVALAGPESVCPSPLRVDGTVPGRLLFYPSELAFAAEPADDVIRPGPTVCTLPVASITAVRREGVGWWRMGRVAIGTGEQAWQVDTFRPARLAADITEHYLERRYA